MLMKSLYKKSLLLLILLFAVGWTNGQAIRQVDQRGNVGALNGLFSVSGNTQVCFSKGNLQYKAATNTWRFAENQWDYVGGTDGNTGIEHGNVYDNGVKSSNNFISSTYNGWIDLFGWGTSGYNHGAVNYQPWATVTDWDSFINSTSYYAYGNINNDLNSYSGKADWGYNAISNGGNQENQWRTLTKDEWVYLINTRSTPSGIRFVHATVNGVIGLILLPDDWDSSIYTLNDINNGEANASAESNVLNVAQWNVLEENGAVFMPKNGFLWLDSYSKEEFNYWSSTHSNDNGGAYNFTYNEYIFQTDASWYRPVGMGVRLVKNASTETSYFIRAIPNQSDLGTVDGSGMYASGETCTLTAIPNEDCVFISWTIDGGIVSTDPTFSFVVGGNWTFVANFQSIVQYTINVSTNPTLGGEVAGVFDFEDGKQGWTTIDNDGDGHNWMISSRLEGDFNNHSGNVCMTSASYVDNVGALTPDNWLVSPQIEMGGSVSLWACGNDPDYTEEHFAIYVSTNGTSIEDFSQITEEYVVGSEYVQYFADLSAYSGMGYVAIRHFNCTDMYYLNVDDITIVSPTFSVKHQEGMPCSFTALPYEGNEFVNWTENGVVVSTDADYSFTVTVDRDLVANYSVNNNSYIITVAATPEEGGTVTGGGTYNHGAVCTLTASSNEGYIFSAWTEDGETVSIDSVYSFRVAQERSLMAVFVPHYTITATANPEVAGVVSFDAMATGNGVYDFEDAVIPADWDNTVSSYPWTIWSSNPYAGTYCMTSGNYNISNSESFVDVVVDFVADGSVDFYSRISSESTSFDYGKFFIDGTEMLLEGGTSPNSWTEHHYDVTVGTHTFRWYYRKDSSVNSGEDRYFIDNISFTGVGVDAISSIFQLGDTCTLIALPNEGYEFVNWTENGEEVSTEAEYTFTVTSDRNLVANFNLLPIYTVSTYSNPEGAGYIEGAGEWYKGDTCTLTAHANEGFQFNSWRENGEMVSESSSYSFAVLSDRVIEAYFVESGYYMFSLATMPEEGGTIMTELYTEIETPFSTDEPIEEQNISIVAKANEGWHFTYWTANNEVVSYDNVYTFHLSGDTDLVAHFEQCELETEPDPELLTGRFSISGCTTVGFAKGNVIAQIQFDTIYWSDPNSNEITERYNPTNASWQFAETQYYRQEYDATYIAANGVGELLAEGMDLVWDVYRSLGLVDISCWHNLTGAEWEYLLNGRPIAIRYAFAKVNDVEGLLVLPDDWDASTFTLDAPNTVTAYETNTITLLDWENTLEPAGALFLPANGMLMSLNGNNQYEFDGGTGNPIGVYGCMLFHPDLGLTDGGATPYLKQIQAMMFSSMRLTQITEQETSTVTVAVEETQTNLGMASGGGIFACGAECTVVATANDGYVFQYWLEGEEVVSVDASYTFAVEGDRNLSAVFADVNDVCNVEFELYSDEVSVGWGGEALQLNFDNGSPAISLTMPAPEVDWNVVMIAQLTGNDYDYDFPQSLIINMPISNQDSVRLSWMAPSFNMGMNLHNTFTARYFYGETIVENAGSDDLPFAFQGDCEGYTVELNLSVDPEDGGWIQTEGIPYYGEAFTVTVVENSCYNFVNWTLNGIEVSTDATFSIVVMEGGDLVAHFEPLPRYTIAATAGNGGRVNGANGFETYPCEGSTCTITATADTDYYFVNWTENGEVVSTDAVYSFVVVEDRNLVANFELIPNYTISIVSNPSEGGSVCFSGIIGASTEVQIGDGTSIGQYLPTYAYYNYSLTQQIYTSSEISSAGTITQVAFKVSNSKSTTRNLDIYLSHTSNTSFSSNTDWISQSTSYRVFSGDVTFNASGWTTITLTTPFEYNGTSNLLLTVDDNTGSYVSGSSNSPQFYTYSTNDNSTIYKYNDGTNYSPSSMSTSGTRIAYKNQLQLYITSVGGANVYVNAMEFQSGETCNLDANPNLGYVFTDWTEDGEVVSTDAEYSFTVTSDRDLVANFSINTYEITATVTPSGAGTVTGTGTYAHGTQCTLTANANEGYTFSNWMENGEMVSTDATYAFTVTGERNLVASFLPTYVITAEANNPEYGSVIGGDTYVEGETCTLTATPNEGYGFIAWTEDGVDVSTEAEYSFTVTEERHLVAVFSTLYTITASANPSAGGTVSFVGVVNEITVHDGTTTNNYVPVFDYPSFYLKCEMVYPAAELNYLAESDITGMKFYASQANVSWGSANFQVFLAEVESDQISEFYGSGTIVYEGALSIVNGEMVVNFNYPYHYNGGNLLVGLYNTVKGSYNVSTWFGETVNGASVQGYNTNSLDAISPTQQNFLPKTTFAFESSQAMATFPSGVTCTVSAQPNGGSVFVNWTEDGVEVSTDTDYSFTVTNDRNLVANFYTNTFEITATASPAEGGTITGAGEFYYGAQCSLTATPNENYIFLYWTENGVTVSTDVNYTFIVTGDRSLVANFIRVYNITASANPTEGGMIGKDYYYDNGVYETSVGTNGGQIRWAVMFPAGTYSGDMLTKVSAYDIQAMTGTVTIYNDGDNAPADSIGGMNVSFTGANGYVDFVFDNPITIDPTKNVWVVFHNVSGATYPVSCCNNTGDANGRWVSTDGTTWKDLISFGLSYTLMVRASIVTSQYVMSYQEGETCTLMALPNEGYGLSEWTENGETVSTDATYSFTVTGDRNLEAVFLPVYVINAEAYPSEYGSVTGAGTFFGGETCSLTAIPAEGYRFNYWTENGSVVFRRINYQFTVTGNRNLEANFSIRNYSITATANPAEGGTVEGGGTYSHGTECWLMAFPNEGYTFSNWTLNGDVVSTDDLYVFTVTSDGDYVANFVLNDYEITANTNPLDGGTVTGAGIYTHGTECTLTAEANEGYTFVNWTVDGNEVGTDPTYTFTVYGEATYVANFSLNLYEITAIANPEEGGTITGTGNYYHGDGCILTAIPNENYTFLYWTENGNYLSSDAIYSFVATSDRSLVAIFAGNEQTINLNQGWTWLSSYIEMEGIDGLGMLENGLNPNGVMIKSQRDGFLSYAANMWIGTLESIANEKMYLVNTNGPAEVTFTGPVASLTNHPITLNPNWSWIGYPAPFAASINDALANLNASEGDVVKTQSAFATYSVDDGWTGSLRQLTPGMGLMYQSHNSQPITLSYSYGTSRALRANVTAENNHWVPDVHAYPNNMSIIAVVELDGEELQDERYELAAFNGDECRGSVRLVRMESLHRHVAFLSVAGEEAAELCLALYDTWTGEAYYNTTDCLDFETNAVLGNLHSPYVARFGNTTSVDEDDTKTVFLYPNPVPAGHLFQMELPAESQGARVSIINALGAEVTTTDVYAKPATLRAPAVPGVYTVRIVMGKEGTISRKLIVK